MAIEYGKCEICGKEAPLTRTYYHYNGLKCDCHSPEHFDLVRHCANCTPVQPRTTRVTLTVEQACRLGELLTPSSESDGGTHCPHCGAIMDCAKRREIKEIKAPADPDPIIISETFFQKNAKE